MLDPTKLAAFGVTPAEVTRAVRDANAEVGARVKKMWLNETRLAGKLRHPYIVEIYEAGDTRPARALMEAGSGRVAAFFYGIFPKALKVLEDAGIRLHYLATWHDVLAEADRGGYFPKSSIKEVKKFLDDPVAWSAAHGGRDAEA